jgi:tetratricopeptide (TPR) repeat protein
MMTAVDFDGFFSRVSMMWVRLSGWLLLSFLVLVSGCATTSDSKRKAEAKEKLGNSLLRDGRYQDALKELIEASELEPNNPTVLFSIGRGYQGIKEHERAISYYRRALQLKPSYSDAWNNLGVSYGAMGNFDMAIEAFRKAADDPLYRTRFLTYENMGAAYHSKGDYKTAIEYYRKAVDFAPDYSSAYEKMGVSYEALKDWNSALAAYKRAGELSPDVARYHLRLGRAYLQVNHQAEAAEALLAAINLDPQGQVGEEARRVLNEMRKRQ